MKIVGVDILKAKADLDFKEVENTIELFVGGEKVAVMDKSTSKITYYDDLTQELPDDFSDILREKDKFNLVMSLFEERILEDDETIALSIGTFRNAYEIILTALGFLLRHIDEDKTSGFIDAELEDGMFTIETAFVSNMPAEALYDEYKFHFVDSDKHLRVNDKETRAVIFISKEDGLVVARAISLKEEKEALERILH